MSKTNYTISMMFRETTHWNVYSPESSLRLFQYAASAAAEGDDHYISLKTALLAQHCILDDGKVAFPLRVIERFDAYRKKLKKEGKEPSAEYAEILNLAFQGHLRATNGLEVRAVKLRALGVSKADG